MKMISTDTKDKQTPAVPGSAAMSALAVLASGIALSFLSFAVSRQHVLDDSVLWYFSQCLLYAGGIFSIREYAVREIGKQLEKRSHTNAKTGRNDEHEDTLPETHL